MSHHCPGFPDLKMFYCVTEKYWNEQNQTKSSHMLWNIRKYSQLLLPILLQAETKSYTVLVQILIQIGQLSKYSARTTCAFTNDAWYYFLFLTDKRQRCRQFLRLCPQLSDTSSRHWLYNSARRKKTNPRILSIIILAGIQRRSRLTWMYFNFLKPKTSFHKL
jgi:hypothetical protein